MIKICQECGKEFEATNGMQKFCNDIHYRTCVICGKKFEVTRYHLTAKDAKTTCSKKCSAELRKRTNIDKYGGVAPACSKQIRDKMETTNLDRYGVKHAAQSDIFKNKSESTCLDRYGKKYYAQTKEGKQRLSDRWSNDEYKNKVVANRISTNIERYGFENPMQSLDVRCKCSASKMIDSSKIESFLQFKESPKEFIASLNLDHKPTIQELTKFVGVNDSTVGSYIHMHNCEDIVEKHVSVMEQEVIDFLYSLDSNIVINHCDRSIITPYEIDIYLPQYRLGIECNPTATHNSDINVFDRGVTPMSPSYHQMKTNLCDDRGIRLIHIFGYEWKYKKQILKSILTNAIGKNLTRIYARNCGLREVDSHEAGEFLSNNHRQGKVGSSIRIGLFYNEELVSLMTFGKLRSTIGQHGQGYELLRFCSKLNTSVIGGANKLFKYFLHNYDPNYIRSFSDRAHTTGNLYGVLGFSEYSRSTPGYCWVNLNTDVAYHRMNAQKQNIMKFLKDDNIDTSKSEREIMTEHGFVRVFDSGTITWEWVKPC